MSEINLQVIATILAIIGSVAGLLKYVFVLLDKHEKGMAEKLANYAQKVKDQGDEIAANREALQRTREEMHSDFVKHKHLEPIRQSIDHVHGRLGGMARDLNRLIGAVTKQVSHEQTEPNDEH